MRLRIRCWQLIPGGLDAPDFARVLGNRAVAAELAAGRNVVDGHLQPLGLVL